MEEDETDNTSWGQYRKLVIKELDRLNDNISSLDGKIDLLIQREVTELKVRLAMVELKVGLIGLAMGVVGSAGTELVKYLIHK